MQVEVAVHCEERPGGGCRRSGGTVFVRSTRNIPDQLPSDWWYLRGEDDDYAFCSREHLIAWLSAGEPA
jgi:hypothetical protein